MRNPSNATSRIKTLHAAKKDASDDDSPFNQPISDPNKSAPVEFGPIETTTEAAPKEVDPAAPHSATVIAGFGLVSFPYENQETGEAVTMNMLRPGDDAMFTTVTAGRPPLIAATGEDLDLVVGVEALPAELDLRVPAIEFFCSRF